MDSGGAFDRARLVPDHAVTVGQRSAIGIAGMGRSSDAIHHTVPPLLGQIQGC
jgi:hypothetical protein